MKQIYLWKGYHSQSTFELVRDVWEKNDLLILFPPLIDDIDFIPLLPSGKLSLVGDWGDKPPVLPHERQSIAPDYPDDPVLGIFTTGTTGQSKKLVLYSKRNITSCHEGIFSFFDKSQIKSVFCYPQPFHTFGLTLGYAFSMTQNKAFCMAEGTYGKPTHEKWCQLKTREVLTLGTPTHFRDLITYVKGHKIVCQPTYTCIIGGARVRADLWCAVKSELGIEKPSIGYGATEASPGVTHLPPGQMPLEDGEVGVALPHLKVEVKRGEGIRFKGSSVCLAIIQDGTIEFPTDYLIADEVEKRSDGILVYRGRNQLVLNRGGEKFGLESIETVLRETFQREVICVRVPDNRLGEELGIVFGPGQGKWVLNDVYGLLEQRFGRRFNPEHCREMEKLPLNANSKIDRQACLASLLKHPSEKL